MPVSPAPPAPWFDAHLDLAYLAVAGRDMTAPLEAIQQRDATAAVTLPALAAGQVRFALGTIFTEVDGTGPEGYPIGDVERAFAVGRAQLEAYLTWRDKGLIALDRFKAMKNTPGTGEIRGGMGVASVVPFSLARRLARLPKQPALHIGILMENADPIRSPEELGWWKDRGLVAIGMSWAKSSRYAGGNSTEDDLTDLGRGLVREMDRLGIVHDASHLSDRAFAGLCEATDKRIIASHSNARALLGDPNNQRHLTDAQIREIVRRGGIIGLNLFAKFIHPSVADTGRPTVDQAVAHVEHICAIAGDRAYVGLGSDMDGGFGADRLPEGVNTPSDLGRLIDALRARNWSDDDILGFVCGNWMRVFAE